MYNDDNDKLNKSFITFTILCIIAALLIITLISCAEGTNPFGDYTNQDSSNDGDTGSTVTIIINPDGTTAPVQGQDADGDGIVDSIDTCPLIANPKQGCDDCPTTCNTQLRDSL